MEEFFNRAEMSWSVALTLGVGDGQVLSLGLQVLSVSFTRRR